jgi:hypothetical protein
LAPAQGVSPEIDAEEEAVARSLIQEQSHRLDPSLFSGPEPRPADGEPVWQINFTVQEQSQTQWCWAAVAASISVYYNAASPWSQCRLANDQLGQATCCEDGSGAACNKPWFLYRALNATGNRQASEAGAASKPKIKEVIPTDRPICVEITWPDGTGHFAVIQGYMEYFDGDMGLHIEDPFYHHSYYFYDEMRTRYQGRGSWGYTQYTKPAG